MPRLFDGITLVEYGQFYLFHGDGEHEVDMDEAFRRQNNGLCGVSMPELLFLGTATSSGRVALTIDAHDAAPAIDDGWEEVVEVSFQAVGEKLVLVDYWSFTAAMNMPGATSLPLAPGTYRVRYSARGMDEAREVYVLNTLERGQLAVDRYRLDFWPAAAAPDVIVRQTSKDAAYRNDWVKQLNQSVA